jgi:hypothetical protein
MKNERKQTNTNGKKSKKSRGSDDGSNKPDAKPKRPLDWDARDLKTNAWVRKSSNSIEGRYTNRFWEEEE